jgi:hypothetical protein
MDVELNCLGPCKGCAPGLKKSLCDDVRLYPGWVGWGKPHTILPACIRLPATATRYTGQYRDICNTPVT